MFIQTRKPTFENSVLRAALCAALRSYSNWGQAIAELLESDKKLSTKFCSEGDIIVAHIVCHIDAILIKLAKKFAEFPLSFPRGFGIVFSLEQKRILGLEVFYPKFANDDRCEALDSKAFAGATSLRAFIKYSGSLLKCGIFQNTNGQICWVVSSKNSGDADNEFVQAFRQLLEPYMTEERLWQMYDLGVRSFCAEAFWDQSHGYRTEQGFVVTCASDGTKFLNANELYSFCQVMGLPTDEPLLVKGEKEVMDFLQQMEKARDLISLPQLQQMLGDAYDLRLHQQLVKSHVMEGFVITLGDGRVVKYKFALYQAVTQFLRKAMQRADNAAPDINAATCPLQELQDWEERKAAFIRQWVVSKEPAVLALWNNILDAFLEEDKTATSEEGVGRWITVSEVVYGRILSLLQQNDYNPVAVCAHLDITVAEPQQMEEKIADVVLVLGPIGYGKSTAAAAIAAQIGGVHIDGDGPDGFLPREVVLKLGWGRNTSTVAAIMGAICSGQVPVVSTGGGAVWCFPPKRDGENYLKHYAKQMGITLRLHVFIPKDMNDYDDAEAVHSTIEGRKTRGEKWDVPMSKLIAGSAGNRKFAEAFAGVAHSVYTYPRCTHDNVPELHVPTVEAPMFTSVAAHMWHQWFTVCDVIKPQLPQEIAAILMTAMPPQMPQQRKEAQADKMAAACKTAELTQLLHRTLDYRSGCIEGSIPTAVASGEVDAQIVFCIKPDGKPLATFVSLPDAPESHLTVAAGAYKPEAMKALALAVSKGETSATLTTQKGSQEMVEFLCWAQTIKVQAHGVVPLI